MESENPAMIPQVDPRNHKEYMKSLKNKAITLVMQRKDSLRRAIELKVDPNDVWQMKQYLRNLKDVMSNTADETMVNIDCVRKELEAYNIGPISGKLSMMKELHLQDMKGIELKGLKEELKLTEQVKAKIQQVTKHIGTKMAELEWRPEEWPWRRVEPTTLQDLEQQYRSIESMKVDDEMRLMKAKSILASLTQSYHKVEEEADKNMRIWHQQRTQLISERDNCNYGRIAGSHLLVEQRCKEKNSVNKILLDRESLRTGKRDIQGTDVELNDSFGCLMKHWNSEAQDTNFNKTMEVERLTKAINREMETKKVLSSLKFCTRDIEELFRKKEIADETFEKHFRDLIVALRSQEKLNKMNVDAFLCEIRGIEELLRNTHFVLENQVENFENLVARDPQSTIPALAGHNNVKVLIQKYDRFITAYAQGFSFYL